MAPIASQGATRGGTGLAIDARELQALKSSAREKSPEATRAAAKQFEAMFMSMVLKSMRESLPKEDMMASDATRLYSGMLDSQMVQGMSKGRGMGIAEMIEKQLNRVQSSVRPGNEPQPALLRDLSAPRLPGVEGVPAKPTASVQGFVNKMLPEARHAAAATGVPEHIILGQAGLESGWGAHQPRHADGTPSHNLFGIKADKSWKGAVVESVTTEYVNGQPRKQVERFRAYSSYAEGFKDYGRLVTTSPRYAGAVTPGGDAQAFASKIHRGGYATDPAYATKLASAIRQTQRVIG